MNEQRFALRQQRTLSEIIEAALNIYVQNFRPLFLIAAVVIPLGVASAAFQGAIDNEVALAGVVIALVLAQGAVNLLAGAALIAALFDIDGGRPAEFSNAYDVAFERFWTLAGALLRAAAIALLPLIATLGGVWALGFLSRGLGIALLLLGLIVSLPWAVNRIVRWLFTQQAVILDGASWEDALGTSADAVDGRWWRTFGIWLVLWIVTLAPAFITAGLFRLAPILVSGTVAAAVNAVMLPFLVTAMTLLYFDLKLRKIAPVEEPS